MRIEILEGKNNFRIYHKLEGIERLTKRATRKGMFNWGRDLYAVARKDIISKEKHGRIYRTRTGVGGKKLTRVKRRRSSAPGETHANFTGALRNSLGYTVQAADTLTFGYGADGKDVPDYAEFVEIGTFKMAARPTLQNTIEKTSGNAETYFQEELNKLDSE